nr:acetyl-CoA carboxylase carboxyltransferase subunit alpha [Asanoa iriomotensis]
MWQVCPRCRSLTPARKFVRNLCVCSDCGEHVRLGARQRLAQLLDPDSIVALPEPDTEDDPLSFHDRRPYAERLREARARTGLDEAVLCATGSIEGHPVVAAVMEFAFLGGSMGAGVGERICAAADTARRTRTPLLIVSASGGARMQEGLLSLMQMAKTSAAMAALDEAGILTVCLVTDPTYGGVAASFVTLADVIIAEPGAHLGFAGPRVIEQTIRQRLPDGFQTAEFLLTHGLIDAIHPRAALRAVLTRLLAAGRPRPPATVGPLGWPGHNRELGHLSTAWLSHRLAGLPVSPGIDPPPAKASPDGSVVTEPDELPALDAWATVQLARHSGRPTTMDYLSYVCDGFVELRGDRMSGECSAIVGGIGRLDGEPLVLIGHQKGHDMRELLAHNFGMPTPAGYRKAARLMRLAAKLGLPVVTLVDTSGAYPGIEAEERGQAVAIAENLRLMTTLPVPLVSVITGEGGSGGALALAVADRVYALGNAVYSVISPEGCASILWRDAAAAPQAAAALHLDSRELLRLGIVDGVIPEPGQGAHTDAAATADSVRAAVSAALRSLAGLPPDRLVSRRRERFRRFGSTPAANGFSLPTVPLARVGEHVTIERRGR